ncbi:hypothetical protein O2K51_04955 [Apibacter raozihei]|uniref:hypothetical protein n=1 Tax=Apibacter raozihei TaxID=2500547 RepID=UPI000FE397D0|nr:hypothetical protein [Apibacter raozihei]
MNLLNRVFSQIPAVLSSKLSIFIYLFLFFYLVIFALMCAIIPTWKEYAPSDTSQLIFGNYTNVLSALGASIAAGSGIVIHKNIRMIHQNHKELLDSINKLHEHLNQVKNPDNNE